MLSFQNSSLTITSSRIDEAEFKKEGFKRRILRLVSIPKKNLTIHEKRRREQETTRMYCKGRTTLITQRKSQVARIDQSQSTIPLSRVSHIARDVARITHLSHKYFRDV